jgi:hypothetical protein
MSGGRKFTATISRQAVRPEASALAPERPLKKNVKKPASDACGLFCFPHKNYQGIRTSKSCEP